MCSRDVSGKSGLCISRFWVLIGHHNHIVLLVHFWAFMATCFAGGLEASVELMSNCVCVFVGWVALF